MHKNAQKVEPKLRPKFAATTPGRSMVKVARLNDASKPSRKSITAAKRKDKEKKERQKKIQKSKSLKT